jgi:branched-chain amino acid transport system ATP-binding protein
MLELDRIDVSHGSLLALRQVTLHVNAGEIVTLIGGNGAGKSTVLKTISGLIRPSRGSIRYQGEAIERMAVEEIVRRGIAHVPEGRRIFPGLTVLGNLEVATSPWRRRGQSYREELEYVFSLFPILGEKRNHLGWSLSGGEQQMLSIGRGLMARPKLLLLDEPSVSLSPKLVRTIFDAIQQINRRGVTLLLVEQNAYAALAISHRGYVLENGTAVLSGTAQDLRRDEKVKKAYLGG